MNSSLLIPHQFTNVLVCCHKLRGNKCKLRFLMHRIHNYRIRVLLATRLTRQPATPLEHERLDEHSFMYMYMYIVRAARCMAGDCCIFSVTDVLWLHETCLRCNSNPGVRICSDFSIDRRCSIPSSLYYYFSSHSLFSYLFVPFFSSFH